MKFTYKSVSGNIEIDISEEWQSVLIELDRQEFNNNQTETRRHCSLDSMPYEGDFFAEKDTDISSITDASDLEIKLFDGLDSLTNGQRKLIEAIFYEGMTEEEYAAKTGVSQSAVSQQKKTALKKLKKHF